LKNVILVVFRLFKFSHSQGHKRRQGRARTCVRSGSPIFFDAVGQSRHGRMFVSCIDGDIESSFHLVAIESVDFIGITCKPCSGLIVENAGVQAAEIRFDDSFAVEGK
jgi:hypothetical protein